jgi:hypothetical protein
MEKSFRKRAAKASQRNADPASSGGLFGESPGFRFLPQNHRMFVPLSKKYCQND